VAVLTGSGERLDADLAVDMSGGRSALPRWPEAVGTRPPAEEFEDCGFIHYARHFRSPDGSLPAVRGPLLLNIGTNGSKAPGVGCNSMTPRRSTGCCWTSSLLDDGQRLATMLL
jgi:hypothetical protein